MGQKWQRLPTEPGAVGRPLPPTISIATDLVVDGTVGLQPPAPADPAFPSETTLIGASLGGANLSGSDISNSDLTAANLNGANLNGSNLSGSNLTGATLTQTSLEGAVFQGVNLLNAVFEPRSLIGIKGIESAANLEHVTYQTNPDGLVKLRKLFQDEGLRQQERKATYALNRRQTTLSPFAERWFRKVAFDFTCQYGMNPGRPLILIGFLWVFFSLAYVLIVHTCGWMRFRVTHSFRRKERTREASMWSSPFSQGHHAGILPWISFEWRVLRAAMFFSLVNAFSIGFREFSIGKWLRLLTPREYEVKATSWARPVAGIQSLATVYFFALWLLTYFGRPFE
jgi:hypothetical protein